MATKHGAAKLSWWLLHVTAWRASGVTETRYCLDHGLRRHSFTRWLKVLTDLESEKARRVQRRKRSRMPTATSRRNQAVQAFWAMHVEALQWSNLSVRVYAEAHRLSVERLYHWRELIGNGTVEIDWRSMLHPSARPSISTTIRPSAKQDAGIRALTEAATVDSAPPAKGHRRRFSVEEKRAILVEARDTGTPLSAIARRHSISTSMVFRWRVALGLNTDPPSMFATVRLRRRNSGATHSDGTVLDGLLPAPKGTGLVELADGRRVFAPTHADPEAVQRAVSDQESESC